MLTEYLKNRRLFRECIEALSPNVIILYDKESDMIFEKLEQIIPFYKTGSRIDWKKIDKKKFIASFEQIIPALVQLWQKPINAIDISVYLLWNDASLPVLKTDLNSVLAHFDDVISVGFETWLFNPAEGYIIEYYYLGEMAIGLVKPTT